MQPSAKIIHFDMERLKRGNIKDGKRFWAYTPTCANGEWWISEERYLAKIASEKERAPSRLEYQKEWKKKKYHSCESHRAKAKAFAMARSERLKNSGELPAIRAEQHKRRMENPIYYLRHVCRARLASALKGISASKFTKTEVMLGCSYDELREHIEKQFKPGMSWGNKGDWEMDHIKPLSAAKTTAEVIELSHFTNIRPLWKSENRKKGANYAKL